MRWLGGKRGRDAEGTRGMRVWRREGQEGVMQSVTIAVRDKHIHFIGVLHALAGT